MYYGHARPQTWTLFGHVVGETGQPLNVHAPAAMFVQSSRQLAVAAHCSVQAWLPVHVSEQVAPAEQLTVVSCALVMLNEHVLAVAHVMVES